MAALTVLVLPLLHEFAIQHQLYEIPPGILSTLSEYVRRVRDVPNFSYLLAFVGGLTLGIWTDAILTGNKARRSEKYAALGDRAVRVREAIQMELDNVNRQRDHASASLLAEVNSLMLDLRKAGIPVPFAAGAGGAAVGAGVIAGAFVEGWSAAITGAAAAKHNAAATAVARAIKARPRSKPSYVIGLNVLVIPSADAPFRCQGTRHRDRPRSLKVAGPEMAIGWGWDVASSQECGSSALGVRLVPEADLFASIIGIHYRRKSLTANLNGNTRRP